MGFTPHPPPVPRKGTRKIMCNYRTELPVSNVQSDMWDHELEGISEGADFCKNVGCVLFVLLFLCSVFFLAGLGLWYWNHGSEGKQNPPPTAERADEELQVPSNH